MRSLRCSALVPVLCASMVLGCGDDEPSSSTEDVTDTTQPLVCAAIRGNGPKIPAHFGALARIHEQVGLLAGAAGGSSGSITTFFLESIYMNPLLTECADGPCTTEETNARAAVLLKSFHGYLGTLTGTEEAAAFELLASLQGDIEEGGIASLLDSDPEAAVDALEDILTSQDLQDLINPEVLDLLANSPDPVFHARDIVENVAAALNFSVSDASLFVRPGLIDFDGLAQKLARVASFYAGYGPYDLAGMQSWLSDCAVASRGLDWVGTSQIGTEGGTCGDRFGALLTTYRTTLVANEASFPSRADDMVGGYLPALISTSVLEGDAVVAFHAARAQYLAGQPVTWSTSFSDVGFGYWGYGPELDDVAANGQGYPDAKTARFRSLGEATWREVLGYSPAEPGLARALELADGRVSAGGWSDLHPVLVLKNLGCDEVIYVTRQGQDSGFATGIATLLGMQDADRAALYDLSNPDSAFSLSLREAGGTWCTNWDGPPTSDVASVMADAYNAPMETSEPFFLDRYEGASEGLGIPGCTPGAQ